MKMLYSHALYNFMKENKLKSVALSARQLILPSITIFISEAEKRDNRNSFVKKTRAGIACIILFDETFQLILESFNTRVFQSAYRIVSLGNS